MGLNPHGPEDQFGVSILISSAGRMEKRTKRARAANWNHAHTMALAELKREASSNKECGPLVWERLAHTLSSRFPGQIRTGAQCRRRWDTLVKVYNHIEDYCVVTGQGHRELDEGELASMELATAYQPDWYDIVEQVCSQRERIQERCDRDRRLAKRIKRSSPDSHSVDLPERPPNIDTLCPASTSKSVTYHKQSTPNSPESTSAYAQVSSSPSLKDDKLSPEEEDPRLKNGNDGLMLEATQLQQHGQVSHQVFQEPQTLESAEYGAQLMAWLKEPQQDDLWDLVDVMPFETPAEIEQSETELELTEPFYWYLESVGLGAQPKEPLQDNEQDYLYANVSKCKRRVPLKSAGEGYFSRDEFNGGWALDDCASGGFRSSPDYMPRKSSFTTRLRSNGKTPPAGSLMNGFRGSPVRGRKMSGRVPPRGGQGPPVRARGPSVHASRSPASASVPFVVPPECDWGASVRMYADCRQFGQQELVRLRNARSGDSTISRQSRRWSLKVIVSKIRQCCHACGRKESAEDMEMESKQAARLRETEARKKALISTNENVPAMFNPASSTSATRGDKPLRQKDTERMSKQAALDRKEEETRSRKAERQQLGGKSSSKCVPIGKLCAKLSRKLFPAFHGQSSH